MAKVRQFLFNIPQTEETYLYKEVVYTANDDINNTGLVNFNLKLTVRQNIDENNAYKFFNTVEGGFFKYEGYNNEAYSRVYTIAAIELALTTLTIDELLKISPVIAILDNRKQLTENYFTITVVDARED